MEDSKAQNKISTLGKAIVKELELDPGVDTLAKWMAHYVAEKIALAEKLSGDKKKQAEEDCFEIISKLWEHRWSIPYKKPFLQDFEPLFETVYKLNPNKDVPFFFPPQFILETEEKIKTSETKEFDIESEEAKDKNLNPQTYLNSALKVDKLARSLITSLLKQAVSGIWLSAEREDLIRNSIEAIDYPESRIIRITSDYSKNLESQTDETDETQNRITEVKSKIDELEELTTFVQSLANRYRKELLELEK